MEQQEHQLGDFHEEIPSLEGYDKPIKKARNILFVIAALQVISILFVMKDLEDLVLYFTIGIMLVVAGIFFGLALWTKRKPYTAIIIALVIYVGLWLLDGFFDPTSLFRGIILKAIAVGLMISALGNAKEVQQWLDLAKKNKEG
ncbi:MAG: hypothetical protein J0I41_01655 [Filimonas sp.]|nr:hypothetical protein [Filimonas sp.]